MSLVNDLANNSTGPAAGSGIADGLGAGVALAAAQQKSDLMGQQLDELKQQHAQKQTDYLIDGLGKASKATSPQIRRVMLDSLNQQWQKAGNPPFDESVLKTMSTDSGSDQLNQALSQLSEVSDASERYKAGALLSQATGQPIGDAVGTINTMLTGLSQAKNREQMQGFAQQKLDQSEARLNEKISHNQDLANGVAMKAQDKAYTDLTKNVESFRGNRVAQQAQNDIYSADKALALVKNKDPNTLSNQDLSLLADEIAKIATGGVPGEHGVQMLLPNSLQTQAAKFQSFISSKPTDAQAGEFVRKNMAYLTEMQNVAKQRLTQYQANIAQGYINKVSPEQQEEFLQNYPHLANMIQIRGQPRQARIEADDNVSDKIPAMVAAPKQIMQQAAAAQQPGQTPSQAIQPAQQQALKAFKGSGKPYSALPPQIQQLISQSSYDSL